MRAVDRKKLLCLKRNQTKIVKNPTLLKIFNTNHKKTHHIKNNRIEVHYFQGVKYYLENNRKGIT